MSTPTIITPAQEGDMSNIYSSQKAQIIYEWEGLRVQSEVSVPHRADGAEAIDFLVRLIDDLSAAYARAEEVIHG